MENETKAFVAKKASGAKDALFRVHELIRVLLGEGGCPWDKNQTPESMRTNLVEEAYEAQDAIVSGDREHIKEELGDVLFNSLLMACMYEKNGAFSVEDVCNEITDKLIRRHPHVFSESEGGKEMLEPVKTDGAVADQWERIKDRVEGRKKDSILDEVPPEFPPLAKAYKYVRKAAKKGFDWPKKEDAFAKVEEEFCEVNEALKVLEDQYGEKPEDALTVNSGNPEMKKAYLHLEEEVGDLLLAVVNMSRKCGVDPNLALDRANRKFYNRFGFVEKSMTSQGVPMERSQIEEMKKLWKKSKLEF